MPFSNILFLIIEALFSSAPFSGKTILAFTFSESAFLISKKPFFISLEISKTLFLSASRVE